MVISGFGSSVVIALAAVLWFTFLVPTWLRRREYLATERNAIRLQQTMRIMAESAELPAVVRMEATARTVAAQQRELRQQQRHRPAVPLHERAAGGGRRPFPEEAAGSGRRPFPEEAAGSGRLEGSPSSTHRLRRSRALASLVLLASLIAAGFGVSTVMATGSWVLVVASAVVAVGAVALLNQAAAVSRARATVRHTRSQPLITSVSRNAFEYVEEHRPGWTPVPLPRPLYLSRTAEAFPGTHSRSLRDREVIVSKGAIAKPDHSAVLRAAGAEAERALRAAQTSPEVTRIQRPAAAPASAQTLSSRFARMGIVEETDVAPANLDDILRRRRAAG